MASMQTQQSPANYRHIARTAEFVLPSSGILRVSRWRQSSIEPNCELPECRYLEQFWLGILGPTSTWLARHLARMVLTLPEACAAFRDSDGGRDIEYSVDIAELGARLGVSAEPLHNSVLSRAFKRLVMFNFAAPSSSDSSALVVRTQTTQVPDRLVARMHPVTSPNAPAVHTWRTY